MGTLLLAWRESVLTKTDCCNFKGAWRPHMNDTNPPPAPSGNPFLGPNGLVLVIDGVRFDGGDATLASSPLRWAHLYSTPAPPNSIVIHTNYNTWLNTTCIAVLRWAETIVTTTEDWFTPTQLLLPLSLLLVILHLHLFQLPLPPVWYGSCLGWSFAFWRYYFYFRRCIRFCSRFYRSSCGSSCFSCCLFSLF